MPQQYIIPPDEGSAPRSAFSVTKYSREEQFPCFGYGSMDRCAFSALADWEIQYVPNGHGMAFRIGTKNEVAGPDGNNLFAELLFVLPVVRKGVRRIPEEMDRLYAGLQQLLVKAIVVHPPVTEKKIILDFPPVPDYMVSELEEILGDTAEIVKDYHP